MIGNCSIVLLHRDKESHLKNMSWVDKVGEGKAISFKVTETSRGPNSKFHYNKLAKKLFLFVISHPN